MTETNIIFSLIILK